MKTAVGKLLVYVLGCIMLMFSCNVYAETPSLKCATCEASVRVLHKAWPTLPKRKRKKYLAKFCVPSTFRGYDDYYSKNEMAKICPKVFKDVSTYAPSMFSKSANMGLDAATDKICIAIGRFCPRKDEL